ncbi:MAG TPA: hypothetical protein VFJ16_14030, partial [Longimicrobium sp.]|nr:hypothetical protein [Longimicrobium sp.]
MPVTPTAPRAPLLPLGVYEVTITGIGGEVRAAVRPVSPGLHGAGTLTPAASGLVFEQIASATFTEGSRTAGGRAPGQHGHG